jgi:mRNA-degrading endonuclease RelE of RelBE toxin-antitoxin system
MFSVVFTKKAEKDLAKLPKDIQKRIIKKVKYFASTDNPLAFSKPLINLPPMTHRFRVGDYRIAFYITNKIINIDRIEHRKDVYLH